MSEAIVYALFYVVVLGLLGRSVYVKFLRRGSPLEPDQLMVDYYKLQQLKKRRDKDAKRR